MCKEIVFSHHIYQHLCFRTLQLAGCDILWRTHLYRVAVSQTARDDMIVTPDKASCSILQTTDLIPD